MSTADGILEDESFDTDELDQSSRDFLKMHGKKLKPEEIITGSKVVDYQYATSQSSLGMAAEEPASYEKTE